MKLYSQYIYRKYVINLSTQVIYTSIQFIRTLIYTTYPYTKWLRLRPLRPKSVHWSVEKLEPLCFLVTLICGSGDTYALLRKIVFRVGWMWDTPNLHLLTHSHPAFDVSERVPFAENIADIVRCGQCKLNDETTECTTRKSETAIQPHNTENAIWLARFGLHTNVRL